MHTHNLLSALALVALGVAPLASTAQPSAPPAIHRRSQRRSPSNFFANLWERRLPITATTTVTVDATSTQVVWVTATSYPGSVIPTAAPSANSTTDVPLPTNGLNATSTSLLPSSAPETGANYTTTASEWWATVSTNATGSLVSPTARPNATRTEGWIVIPTDTFSPNVTATSHHFDASSAAASEASSIASASDISSTLTPIVTGVSSTVAGGSDAVSLTSARSTGIATASATATLKSSSVASTVESQSTRPASSVQASSGVASSTGVSSTRSQASSVSVRTSTSPATSTVPTSSLPSSSQVSSSSSVISVVKTASATLSAPTSVRTDLPSSEWKSLGCAVDEGGRVLSDYYVSRGDMTIDVCLDICQDKGFKYAGVEYGEECMCGNSLKQGVSYDTNQWACSTPCAGDATKTCGGGWRMDVYQMVSSTVTSTRVSLSNTASRTASATVSAPTSVKSDTPDTSKWAELGCAVDEGGRILTDYYVSRNDMTIDLCLDICQDAGFNFAGVEYGQECMCGKALKNGVAYDSNAWACSTPCAGDASKLCGGGWRMALYEFASAAGTTTRTSASVVKPTPTSVSSSSSVIVSTTRTTSSTAAIPTTTSGSSLTTTPLNDRIVAGYYPDWSVWTFPPTQLDFNRIDVVDFAFAIVNAQYGLEFTQYNSEDTLNWLVRLAHAKGKKVRLSIGGWTGSVYFSPAVATDRNRQVLAQAILTMYQKFNLDGIDLDWEYPGVKGADNNIVTSEDSANYLIFLRLLRKTLPPTAILSAATQVWPFAGPTGAPLSDVSEFAKLLDWVMIMNYDIWGSSATTPGPNAPLNDGCGNSAQPLANAYAAVSSWTTAGMPAKQIVLGLPAYGYMQESRADSLRARKRRSLEKKGGVTLYNADGGTSYGQIKFGDMISQGGLSRDGSGHWVGANGFTRYWDTCSSTPWLKSSESGQIITYDDPISISLKAQFARQAGLRGTNFWEITGDSSDWSLLDAARSGLGL